MRPLGVYAVRDDQVTWHAAVDHERIALIGVATGFFAAVLGTIAVIRRPPWPDLHHEIVVGADHPRPAFPRRPSGFVDPSARCGRVAISTTAPRATAPAPTQNGRCTLICSPSTLAVPRRHGGAGEPQEAVGRRRHAAFDGSRFHHGLGDQGCC